MISASGTDTAFVGDRTPTKASDAHDSPRPPRPSRLVAGHCFRADIGCRGRNGSRRSGRLEPESDRARVSFALVGLTRGIYTGDMHWSALRETMAIVMDYPVLARRAMPLMVPFFEIAA